MINTILQKLILTFEEHKSVFDSEGAIRIDTKEWHDLFDEYPIGYGLSEYMLHYYELYHLAFYNIGFVKWELKFDKEKFGDEEIQTAVWLQYKYRADCQE